MTDSKDFVSGYSPVNGLEMYYEIHGEGKPLVLIHGGGSTIQTSFGRIIPLLAKNRQVMAMELQAHGRTNDRDNDSSFEQDADDVSMLLKNLGISQADFLGFSNGGHTLIEIAIRHPELVHKIILCSTFINRSGVVPQFWEEFENAGLSNMPKPYHEAFLKVNNDPEALLKMFNRDLQRMKVFKGWTKDQLGSIKSPTLVVNGNHDIGSPEHAVEMFRIIPNCELTILPGGHGDYIGEITTAGYKKQNNFIVPLIEDFLDK